MEQIETQNSISPEDFQKTVYLWNQTHSNYPKNKLIIDYFEAQVAKAPDHIALRFGDQILTYQELNNRSNQIAHYLLDLGINQKTLIAICMESSLDLFVGILGIIKAGAAYLPLDPDYPNERLQFMLEDTKAPLLITKFAFADSFKNKKIKIICVDKDEKITNFSTENPKRKINLSDLVYVIYTSGSTGKPKGVMISHLNLNTFINWFGQALEITPDDIFDFSSSISFDFSVATTLFPLTQGATVVICSELQKKDPQSYLQYLQVNKINYIKLTPSYFRQLSNFVSANDTLLNLKYIIFGGEMLYAKDLKNWLDKFPQQKMFCEYGPTEATVATSWMVIDRNNLHKYKNSIPIGKPALNTALYILDSKLQPQPIGTSGELYIGGEGVGQGYLNRKEITAEKFITNPFNKNSQDILYKTGDLCRYLPDGNVEILGRMDHQTKIRGFRIEFGEIEACLVAHPLIKEALVTVYEHPNATEKQLVAYIVYKNQESQPVAEELREHIFLHLPDYMLPNFFVSLESLPLTQNGKVDRNKLPKPEVHLEEKFIVPSTPTEKTILAIWSTTLNNNKISVSDNFFELGGNSLLAARIITQITKTLNKEVKFRDFYHCANIIALAKLVDSTKAIKKLKVVEGEDKAIINSTTIPLSELQFVFWLINTFYRKNKVLNIVARKRLASKLDMSTLQLSLNSLLKRHEILSYQISSFFPQQLIWQCKSVPLQEIDLSELTHAEQEQILSIAIQEGEKHEWEKGFPLIAAKAFLLDNNITELQLCLSHLISDEISPEILFGELSDYYINHNIQNTEIRPSPIQFKDYIYHEKQVFNSKMMTDIKFWEEYLKDTALYAFPNNGKANSKTELLYSTYLNIPEVDLHKLHNFCSNHHLSLTDSLCAAVGKTVANYLDTKKTNKSNVVLNFVKSTRDNDIYDRTIGLFVRTSLLKMNLEDNPTFLDLSKRVQQSVAETDHHQACPTTVKLACMLKKDWHNKKIGNYLVEKFTQLYTNMFHKLHLNPQMLLMMGRIFLAGHKNNYFVNVNIMNNFMIANTNHQTELFNAKLQTCPAYQSDKSVAKNVLDIWFVRDTENNPTIILSGNVNASLRESIGKQILNNLVNGVIVQ